MGQRKYDIAVIAGDGTGPEVIGEGVKVVEAVSSKYDFQISFDRYDLGG
ncbi:MAG: isocitrate/isopropylmalate family dehydrogenase, partial [Desulfobacteria bacterium]